MATNRGQLLTEIDNDELSLDLFIEDRLFEPNLIIDLNRSYAEIKTGIKYGQLVNSNLPNTSIVGTVQVNNNPVIREVVVFNQDNIMVGKTISNSSGVFTVQLGGNKTEVYSIARDPKCSFVTQVSNTNPTVSLQFTDGSMIAGTNYPTNLPPEFLINSILEVGTEQMLVTAISSVSDSEFNNPSYIVVTCTRGYNSTTATAHLGVIGKVRQYNDIMYAHQVGL